MGGTKRMSKDEKCNTILGIYHKTKSVYTEKEIIALATKEGVTPQTIVDINNSLVDDGLVEKAKIGGSNYFWSFPAKKDRMMQISYEKLLSTIEATKLRVEETKARLVDAKRGREDDDDDDENDNGGGGGRSQKLARLSELASEKTQLEAELQKLKANDPQALADLEKELQFVTHAAHRWTDNIFNAKTYLVKKKGMDKKEANRLLNITDDFDYPEEK